MRISSSTARTLAMPARKIAWLSAKINLSIFSSLQNSLQEFLRLPHELVRINHAGHTSAFVARFILPYHSALALNGYVFLAAGYVRGQSDFKFHWRTHLQRRVSADVNPRRAQIPGYALGVAAGIVLMN